jgi:crotonobetainyl-CoA:carnitine CoA-transferase CaiB-like acyl-CoA transferase
MPNGILPLDDLLVLDLTRARSGPTAVRQLADWGADVIKIEEPSEAEAGDGIGGERDGFDFQNLQRNKRSIILNLKSEAAREVFFTLARKADVIIENYRPDVKTRLGIDYEAVRKINPRIIYGSISGFGQDGPYQNRPGFDQIAQGMGGLMSVTGLPGQGPVRVGVPIADLTAGMYLSIGILVALHERERSGEGQWVHTSLLEAQIAMLDFQAARWTIAHEIAPQAGNDHPTSIPTGVFQTKDGYINIAASGDPIYHRLCQALEAPELITDPRFEHRGTRSKNRVQMNQELEKRTATRTSAEWIEALNKAGVPSGPIYTIDQTMNDPQVKHIEMAKKVKHPRLGELEVLGHATNLARSGNGRPAIRRPAPDPGEHTVEVLKAFGYDDKAIEKLRAEGATV